VNERDDMEFDIRIRYCVDDDALTRLMFGGWHWIVTVKPYRVIGSGFARSAESARRKAERRAREHGIPDDFAEAYVYRPDTE